MLIIALIAFVMFLLFKWKEKDSGLDGFAAITIVIVPGGATFVVNILVKTFQLPPPFLWINVLMFFVWPWLLLWKNNHIPCKRAAVYGVVVCFCYLFFSAVALAPRAA